MNESRALKGGGCCRDSFWTLGMVSSGSPVNEPPEFGGDYKRHAAYKCEGDVIRKTLAI